MPGDTSEEKKMIGASALVGLSAATTQNGGWQPDFANTAWGAIVAALVSATIGIFFKFLADRDLAKRQADLTIKVQDHVLEVQGGQQSKLQTAQAEVQREITRLKATLDNESAAASARRSYEFDARKRLYADVEPLLFQIYEGLEEAHYRVLSLARTDRAGHLRDGDNWLGGRGYYLASTSYKLVLPAAHFRLLQRRMTFFDFGLDPQIDLRYLLLKTYVRSFTDDFDFAKAAGLDYDPNHRDWRKLREGDPARYERQAVLLGTLEKIADKMIVSEGEKQRAMSFGEFEALLNPIEPSIQEAVGLFQGFSPTRKPVLAHLLIAQACLARLILSTYHQGIGSGKLDHELKARVFGDESLISSLDWNGGSEKHIVAAKSYLTERLVNLEKELAIRRSLRPGV